MLQISFMDEVINMGYQLSLYTSIQSMHGSHVLCISRQPGSVYIYTHTENLQNVENLAFDCPQVSNREIIGCTFFLFHRSEGGLANNKEAILTSRCPRSQTISDVKQQSALSTENIVLKTRFCCCCLLEWGGILKQVSIFS